MIHVTTYAIQRYQDQVRNLPDRDVLALLSGPVIELAADFGAPCVRLPTGHRVMLKGRRVITVFAAGTGRGTVFGWGIKMSQADLFAEGECTSPAQLTPAEAIVYRMIYDAAEAGEPCPMNIDIEIAIGANSSSMGPVTVKRLERKGLIEVSRYYRARIVRIVATGKETAPPPNERTDLPRADRGTHCDGPLLTALVDLGVPEHVADLMIGSGLPGLSKIERLANRVVECAAKRRNGFLLGAR
jgi:hypothetical protein